MKYHAPYGSTDPDASYVDKDVPGAVRGSAVPAKAIEDPQREIVNVITKSGKVPDNGNQLAKSIQSGWLNFSAIGGTANALTMTLPEVPASWADLVGTPLRGIITATNTGACTLNVNGLGAKPIKIDNGTDPIAGDLKSGSLAVFVYDGTNVQIAFSSSMMKNRLNAGATIVTYAAAGSFPWVVPADVRSVFVRVWGAGGGGGGSQNPGAAGGGGGGGYAEGYVTVTPGSTVTVTVGAGGAGGTFASGGSGYGATGGTSSFGPSISATGGGGGERALANSQGVSGGGGTGTGGSRQAQGGTGSSGTFVANTQNVQLGGSGGAAGGGGGGGGGASSGLGSVGQSPGGGGGAGAGGQVGSAGAAGTVIIEYFVS